MLSMNRKFARARKDGYFDIRVFHRSRRGKKDPRFLFKCGCCNGKLEVYYGGDSLEINGVMGSVENWRELFLPLLNMKLPSQEPRKQKPSRPANRAGLSGPAGGPETARKLLDMERSRSQSKRLPPRLAGGG